jgi:hypothetical protein
VAPIAQGQSTKPPETNAWAKAEAAMNDHLKRIDSNMRHAEFKSQLLRQYLPDVRIFVRYDRHLSGETRIFVLNQRGEITPLPNEEWRGDADGKYFQVASVAEFVRSRKIPVKSAAQAVEVAKLFEDIQGAANYVAFLWINTKEFSAFDKAFIEGQFGPRIHWKYTGAPRTNGWTVQVEYVGPPASIRKPPMYHIDVDEEQRFRDLRSY